MVEAWMGGWKKVGMDVWINVRMEGLEVGMNK